MVNKKPRHIIDGVTGDVILYVWITRKCGGFSRDIALNKDHQQHIYTEIKVNKTSPDELFSQLKDLKLYIVERYHFRLTKRDLIFCEIADYIEENLKWSLPGHLDQTQLIPSSGRLRSAPLSEESLTYDRHLDRLHGVTITVRRADQYLDSFNTNEQRLVHFYVIKNMCSSEYVSDVLYGLRRDANREPWSVRKATIEHIAEIIREQMSPYTREDEAHWIKVKLGNYADERPKVDDEYIPPLPVQMSQHLEAKRVANAAQASAPRRSAPRRSAPRQSASRSSATRPTLPPAENEKPAWLKRSAPRSVSPTFEQVRFRSY
ncbi:MAG: hypothetical protein Q9195_006980 [Heterodermia aff. obscurata]